MRLVWGRWRTHLAEIARFFSLRLLTGVGNAVKIEGVALLVNVFAGVALSASWGVAAQIRCAFQSVCDGFQQACSPTIYKRMASGDVDGTRTFLCWEIALSFLLVGAPVLFWLAFSNKIMSVWIGADRPVGLASLAACSALWALVDAASGPLTVAIQATGRIALFQIVNFLFACLGFCGAWIVLSNGGSACGAMVCVVVSNALSLGYRFVHIRFAGILNTKNE